MEVLESITQPKNANGRAIIFEELYEQTFPCVARFVRKMGGSLADAQDIFQDALVIYYEKKSQEELVQPKNPEAYLVGISKHLWIRKFKQDRNKVSFSDFEHELSIPSDYFPEFNSQVLLNFLEKAGKKCLDLLRSFYYDKNSMQEIALGLGYKNERSATVQKYKCIEKVRDSIKEKSIGYEDFIK
jgi:RNA polymerase sigma factor (sigma-70 family)